MSLFPVDVHIDVVPCRCPYDTVSLSVCGSISITMLEMFRPAWSVSAFYQWLSLGTHTKTRKHCATYKHEHIWQACARTHAKNVYSTWPTRSRPIPTPGWGLRWPYAPSRPKHPMQEQPSHLCAMHRARLPKPTHTKPKTALKMITPSINWKWCRTRKT